MTSPDPEPSVLFSDQSRFQSSHSYAAGDMHEHPSSQDQVPENWLGWAELENDPVRSAIFPHTDQLLNIIQAIFSTLLIEWGVPSIEVQEIVELDQVMVSPPELVCGLILLARWTPPERLGDNVDAPKDLWFANQVSSYSCASVAIMNIVNNRPDLDLGPELNFFRERTMELSPKARGIALDCFDFVRNKHNSFATEIDKLNIENLLRDDVVKWERKKRFDSTGDGHRRKRRRVTMSRNRKRVISDHDYQDNGFHFIAYAPCGDALWKMDGLEPLPKRMNTGDNENWLYTAAADLQDHTQQAAASGFEFSLLSLVKRDDNLSAVANADDMRCAREDWGPFISHMVQLHAEKGDIKEMIS